MSDLVSRLEAVRKEHDRLASWNRSKDRPARVALHHDASLAIRDAIAGLKATSASLVGTNGEAGSEQKPVVTELVEFGKHRNWELSYSYAEDDECWCVHQVNGGINDREWTCIGKGVTPAEAIEAALSRQAQTGNGEKGA